MDKSQWPRCLLWHGWLPLLSGVDGASTWAATAGEAAVNMLECTLCACSAQVLSDGEPPNGVDGMLLPVDCLRTVMSGLMVVLFLMRLLVRRLLGLGFMLGYALTLCWSSGQGGRLLGHFPLASFWG